MQRIFDLICCTNIHSYWRADDDDYKRPDLEEHEDLEILSLLTGNEEDLITRIEQLFNQYLKSNKSRSSFIDMILNKQRRNEQKKHTNDSKKELIMETLIRTLIASLNTEEKKDIYETLIGLPPAVLGDEDDRDQTRVLVDLEKDVLDDIMLSYNTIILEKDSSQTICQAILNVANQLTDSLTELDQSKQYKGITTEFILQCLQTIVSNNNNIKINQENQQSFYPNLTSRIIIQQVILNHLQPDLKIRQKTLDLYFSYDLEE